MAKYQDLSRFRVPEGFRGRSGLYVQLWWLVQAVLIGLSPQPLYGWRAWLWRRFGAEVGQGVKIRPSARVTYPWKVRLGDHVWIGDRAELYSLDRIEIGDNACISQDCYLCTGSHDPRSVDFRYDCAPIRIEPEVWLAAGCFVGPGVTVGLGTVIGARSLVLRDVPEGRMAAGNPLRDLGAREARDSD
ncbi:putative colanic acid biosynthesis acetyltransferase [Pacificoceanicola onchidii]|uniref:putative colanic acid biosynthesis acetyltransferase n=1 Tax=Pacificoceanicola onchidii TaxID=2562685 RepID=UPI0010A63F53|nr:putative colanic acid biosynthesis acetyltransferase [Pacificoceanicola onchidii]